MAAERGVLVVGGGLAGATAALELAGQGVPVTLVEKGDFLGGWAARLACKALEACQKCNVCLAAPRLEALLEHPGIRCLRRAQVVELARKGHGFRAKIRQRPAYIDPERCTGCGLCLRQCPASADGAIRRAILPGDQPRLALDPSRCLYFKDHRSTLCRDICPEEAIRLDLEPSQLELEAGALILATGFTPYRAAQKERLGHGRLANVVTALELEEGLRRQGAPLRPSDGRPPQSVAFIQCVGSRELTGHNYCSRVCCGYALRLGRALHGSHGVAVSLFYMDLQSFGHALDDFLDAAARELELIRSLPYDVTQGPGDSVLLEYQAQPGQPTVRQAFDLLVLSTGMAPSPDNQELALLAGLERDQHGFLRSGSGIFVAGAAGGPADMAEVVAQAGRAAMQALTYLEAS